MPNKTKMAQCKAWGCYNNKDKNKGISYHRFPKRFPEIAKQWLHNCGTGIDIKDLKFGANSIVCANHFEPSCYKIDKVNRSLGKPERRELYQDAVPTIFVHRKRKLDTGREGRAEQRQHKKEYASAKKVIYNFPDLRFVY